MSHSEYSLGTVCCTHSDICILDIGLWLDGEMFARSGTYAPEPRYGGVDLSRWTATDVKISLKRWKQITYNKGTDDICDELGIPYYQKFKKNKRFAGDTETFNGIQTHDCVKKTNAKPTPEEQVAVIIQEGMKDHKDWQEIGMEIFYLGQKSKLSTN